MSKEKTPVQLIVKLIDDAIKYAEKDPKLNIDTAKMVQGYLMGIKDDAESIRDNQERRALIEANFNGFAVGWVSSKEPHEVNLKERAEKYYTEKYGTDE